VRVFRIVKRAFASDLSGTGAALYPGRWNQRGTPVLYTGSTKEIALLEFLVHLPPMMGPELDILTLQIPDDSISELKVEDLPKNWSNYPAPSILSELGASWVKKAESLALSVPSVIIHSAKNIVINCAHPRFTDIKVIKQKPFVFDSRLKK
jgi:RES domain-containing protein